MPTRHDTITFLSDYGYEDEFVGVCHAVISQIVPGATVIDLTHGVAPFDVRAGSGAQLNILSCARDRKPQAGRSGRASRQRRTVARKSRATVAKPTRTEAEESVRTLLRWIDREAGTGVAYFATGVATTDPGARSAFSAIEEQLAAGED